ncbi:amidase [Granulosicoccus sp. 3-233]|uniref:amidase n=1 Tax=Granulosicoccus sp. 3-233 TaxID=3417969 RepID=UPI003D32C1A1
MNSELKMTASDVARLLYSGEMTCVDLITELLLRIRDSADQSIFITVTEEQALAEARASDERRALGQTLGPWDGVPLAWKDLFDTRGDITTAGSRVHADVAQQDAAIVAVCRQHGLISLGKTNLSEFAYSGLGLNPHHGTPVNPASSNDARAPGGSSSGSAVAVAAGLVPIAVGTDTAGSVRVPASFCGIAGYKSSQSRYPSEGIFPLSRSLDSVGLFAHDMDDIIMLDAVMRGKVVEQLGESRLSELSFLVPDNVVFDQIEDDVLACFEETVKRLKNAGARIRREPFPIFDEVSQLFQKHGTLTVAEAATLHQNLLASAEAELMDQRVRERMGTASAYTAQDYIQLQWARERLQQQTAESLGDTLLLFPTTVITAPSIAALEADDEHFRQVNLLTLKNTMLGNYLGTPGVSLPIGKDGQGLPIGVLVSAAVGQDDRLLSVCKAVESALMQ